MKKKPKTIFLKRREDFYHLNSWELEMLKRADEDIKQGRVLSQEEVSREIREWFRIKEEEMAAK